MIKNLSLLLTLGLSLFLFSCNEDEVNPIQDKEVRLTFPFDYWTTNKTQFELSPNYTYLLKFNKANYANLSSIKLYSSLRTNVVGDTAEIELFNVTDNVAIGNTTLTGSTIPEANQMVQTNNIINELPDKEIDLGLRLKSKHGEWVNVTTPVLILSRD